MIIEYVMYFTLGFLIAGLIALAIGTAVWNRAVRLTRKRMEAATPVTLSEFRADKDKLRAEHAIAVRRLEMRIEALREKLAARVIALDTAATELGALRAERDDQYDAIGALQVREQELVARIRDLERDGAALAARIRQSDADLSDIDEAIMPESAGPIDAGQLSGDYRNDVEDLLTALSIERQRNSYLEDQVRMLLSRLEKKKKVSLKDDAIAMLRDTLAANDDADSEARVELRKAEARIAGAESRLNALLAESHPEDDEPAQAPVARLLADALSDQEQLDMLRANVEALGAACARDWGTPQFDATTLRARLEAIASDVSQIVYAADADDSVPQSLFDTVRKFAGGDGDDASSDRSLAPVGSGAVSERMAALRDIQGR